LYVSRNIVLKTPLQKIKDGWEGRKVRKSVRREKGM
jgi:hypothetical protein